MKLNTNTFLTLMISILTILLEPLPQHHRLTHYGQYMNVVALRVAVVPLSF